MTADSAVLRLFLRWPRVRIDALETLLDLPIVGNVRGAGYFYGIELVKDKTTREFNEAESERLLRGFLSKELFDAGLYCRADDRGDPVVQLSPPLTIGPAEHALTFETVVGRACRDRGTVRSTRQELCTAQSRTI